MNFRNECVNIIFLILGVSIGKGSIEKLNSVIERIFMNMYALTNTALPNHSMKFEKLKYSHYYPSSVSHPTYILYTLFYLINLFYSLQQKLIASF